jgi:hypothetical protein
MFSSNPPMLEKEFLDLCKRYLPADEYGEVADSISFFTSIEIPTSTRSRFLSAYLAWERTFRNELVLLRAKSLNTNSDEYIRSTLSADEAEKAAAECFAVQDPLQAEITVEKERWMTIERLAPLPSFDIDFVIAYRIKLAILARLASFDAEKGMTGYKHLYSDILANAPDRIDAAASGEHA